MIPKKNKIKEIPSTSTFKNIEAQSSYCNN